MPTPTITFKRVLRDAVFAVSGLGGIGALVDTITHSDPTTLHREYLELLLKYAKNHCEYYRSHGGNTDDLTTWPILTKQTIRSSFTNLQSDEKRLGSYQNSSGGSTGNPTTVLQDLEFRRWTDATVEYYFRNFLKVSQYDVPHVILWGSDRDTLRQNNTPQRTFNWLCNTTLLNSFLIGPKQWEEYISAINQIKPVYIRGYVSSLYELAKYVQRTGRRIHTPKFAYSTAETLFPHIRATIEEVLQCKLYNFYGSREVGATAGECERGKIHIFNFNNHVELAPGEANQEIGGALLITNLHNYVMPTIRYQIGDTALLSNEQCPCGSRLPIISKITGRIADHFRKKDGTMIYGDFFSHLFYGKSWIGQFQVNQTDYTNFEIQIVLAGNPPEKKVLSDIETNIHRLMNGPCEVKWVFTDQIPATPQGKHLYTRCLIKD